MCVQKAFCCDPLPILGHVAWRYARSGQQWLRSAELSHPDFNTHECNLVASSLPLCSKLRQCACMRGVWHAIIRRQNMITSGATFQTEPTSSQHGRAYMWCTVAMDVNAAPWAQAVQTLCMYHPLQVAWEGNMPPAHHRHVYSIKVAPAMNCSRGSSRIGWCHCTELAICNHVHGAELWP